MTDWIESHPDFDPEPGLKDNAIKAALYEAHRRITLAMAQNEDEFYAGLNAAEHILRDYANEVTAADVVGPAPATGVQYDDRTGLPVTMLQPVNDVGFDVEDDPSTSVVVGPAPAIPDEGRLRAEALRDAAEFLRGVDMPEAADLLVNLADGWAPRDVPVEATGTEGGGGHE